MKSREMRACPRPFGTRNQVGGTSSVLYEVVRKESLSSSIWYKESSTQDIVHQYEVVLKDSLSSSVRYEESSRWDFIYPV